MGDAPPQDSKGVGQIREIQHFMVLSCSPLTQERNSQARSSILIGIFACIGALRRVMGDGWIICYLVVRLGRANPKHWAFFGLKGAVLLFTCDKNG